jgi:trehalose 6-phosphate phosphatase
VTALEVPPDELAALTAAGPGRLLVGLDVDGVLAPIVDRADRARLLPGVTDVLASLGALTPVAVISGRSLVDLEERYSFPSAVTVVGSHGLETRGEEPLTLSDSERRRLAELVEVAERARGIAGAGAWLEHKPASVVLHLREARAQSADRATHMLVQAARRIDGAHVKLGHYVVELFARAASKATAIAALRDRIGASCVAFAGDDRTDEEVFCMLEGTDVTVRVGPGDTAARFRLPDPSGVLTWLVATVDRLTEGMSVER